MSNSMIEETKNFILPDEGGDSAGRRLLEALFDSRTFAETGRFVGRTSSPGDRSGVITGYGSVGGRLVFAFAEDRSRMKAASDEAAGRKICDLFETALENGAPVVGIFDSDGVALRDGISSLTSIGRLASASAAAAGRITKIALIGGVCGGIEAAVASSFDFVITLKTDKGGSDLFAVPPFSSETSIDPSADGISCIGAKSEEEAAIAARKIISLIPGRRSEALTVSDSGDQDRSPDLSGLTGYALCEAVSDPCGCLPLFADYSKGLAIALAQVGGVGCFIAAGDREVSGGALTRSAADALCRCVRFADAFGIPLVMLTDCPGTDPTDGSPAYLRALSDLAAAVSSASCPRITAYVGRAYGAGYLLLGSKATGADAVFALTDAAVGALSPETSVAFLWNEKIDGEETTREKLEAEWRKTEASPAEAAALGEIDDIVAPDELRPRIVSAVYMLLGKRRGRGRRL